MSEFRFEGLDVWRLSIEIADKLLALCFDL